MEMNMRAPDSCLMEYGTNWYKDYYKKWKDLAKSAGQAYDLAMQARLHNIARTQKRRACAARATADGIYEKCFDKPSDRGHRNITDRYCRGTYNTRRDIRDAADEIYDYGLNEILHNTRSTTSDIKAELTARRRDRALLNGLTQAEREVQRRINRYREQDDAAEYFERALALASSTPMPL